MTAPRLGRWWQNCPRKPISEEDVPDATGDHARAAGNDTVIRNSSTRTYEACSPPDDSVPSARIDAGHERQHDRRRSTTGPWRAHDLHRCLSDRRLQGHGRRDREDQPRHQAHLQFRGLTDATDPTGAGRTRRCLRLGGRAEYGWGRERWDHYWRT